MLQIGDVVLYGLHGICKIGNIEVKQVGKTSLDYYVLNPVFNQNTAVFVPIDNEQLVAKMQRVLTEQEALDLIQKSAEIELIKTRDEATRREKYREILGGGDREKLLALIKTIRADRTQRFANNKKLSMADEQTLYKSEQILFNEIAFVLGISPAEAQEKIKF